MALRRPPSLAIGLMIAPKKKGLPNDPTASQPPSPGTGGMQPSNGGNAAKPVVPGSGTELGAPKASAGAPDPAAPGTTGAASGGTEGQAHPVPPHAVWAHGDDQKCSGCEYFGGGQCSVLKLPVGPGTDITWCSAYSLGEMEPDADDKGNMGLVVAAPAGAPSGMGS